MIGRAVLSFAALAVGGCGERAVPGDTANVPRLERVVTAPVAPVTPVRVGEAGPAFRACQAAGTPRDPDAASVLPVRGAPFDNAGATARIPGGARFFICTRSIDQRWMGVVFAEDGTLSPGCGVSGPVPRRAAYEGPCRSGWVASAAVRSVAT